jgi:hypothetical protein
VNLPEFACQPLTERSKLFFRPGKKKSQPTMLGKWGERYTVCIRLHFTLRLYQSVEVVLILKAF